MKSVGLQFAELKQDIAVLRKSLVKSKEKEDLQTEALEKLRAEAKKLIAGGCLGSEEGLADLRQLEQEMEDREEEFLRRVLASSGTFKKLKLKEEELKILEPSYIREQQQILRGRLYEVEKQYVLADRDLQVLGGQAAKVKAQRRSYHDRRLELEGVGK